MTNESNFELNFVGKLTNESNFELNFVEKLRINKFLNWILSKTDKWINIWIEFFKKLTYEYFLNRILSKNTQALQYGIWNLGLASKSHYKCKIWTFGTKMGLFWDSFGTFLGLLAAIYIKNATKFYDTARLFVFNSAFNQNALPNMHHYSLIPLDWEVQRFTINSHLIMG